MQGFVSSARKCLATSPAAFFNRESMTRPHGNAIASLRRRLIPAKAGIQWREQRLAAKSGRPLSRAGHLAMLPAKGAALEGRRRAGLPHLFTNAP
jgi:hypothetical protein